MTKKLTNKVALVTGASKGIGAAIAVHLASEGASVVVNYSSSKAGADKVVAEITHKGGKAVALQANLTNPKEVQGLVAATKKTFGPIDILVNNAGVYEFAPLDEITPENFHKHFDLNVLGLLLVSKETVRAFNEKGGSIINISSVVSTAAPAGSAVYSATKGAVDTITMVLAKELAPKNIRVNAVNPGMIITEGTSELVESDMGKYVKATALLGRLGKPEEIAGPVVFLASDESSYVTGTTLVASGGLR